MNIGVLKENPQREGRVAITPANTRALVLRNHKVFVQSGAGEISRFYDEDYLKEGATIVYNDDEIYGRSDLVVKIAPPTAEEYNRMLPNQIFMAAFHLAIARKEWVQTLLKKKVTAIGYEVIEEDDGSLPIVMPMSEIAGQICIQVACQYLQSDYGGRGILLGGIAGVPPANVVILGGGRVGTSAARAAIGLGAQVIVIDHNLKKLQRINELFNKRVITTISNRYNIEKAVKFADVLIGAVLVHGQRTPILVTREMVRSMRPNSLIIDLSIDQGGCIETSRPTTISHPTYVEDNVTHYCVPNMPTKVARTATYAFSNASLPFIQEIADFGIVEALRRNRALARGVYTFNGVCTNPNITEGFGLEYKPLASLLENQNP